MLGKKRSTRCFEPFMAFFFPEAHREIDWTQPHAVVVLAHLKTLQNAHDDESRRVAQVRLVKGLYERGYGAEQVRQLYRLMERMMTLPKPLAEMAWNEIHEFEKEKGRSARTRVARDHYNQQPPAGMTE
jgi:hypothetical protein